KRQLVERMFQEQLSKTFNDFAAGKLQPARAEAVGSQSGDLSLVEDTELEESLAIASMVAKAENRLARALFAVNQRLSVIRGGAKIEDSTNPIAPAPLCQAFRQSMRELELNLETKLIVYKLFDRYVMTGLDALYDEVNMQLVQAGVLPQIRHTMPNAGRAPRPLPPPGQMMPPGAEVPMGDANAGYAGYAQPYDVA